MMDPDDKTVLNGIFTFKKCPDGSVDRRVVLCGFCRKPFSYHRSTSSLKYHLNAKHSAAWTKFQLHANYPPATASTEVRVGPDSEDDEVEVYSRRNWSHRRRLNNSDGGGQANPNTSPQNTATTQGGIKEESTDMMMSADSPTVPHTVLVGYKFENPGLDVTTPDHDTAQLHAMELQTWAPEGIKASGSSQFSGVDLDSMDLDQLKREKIKMQLKVLKLQEEYYMLQIKKLKQ
ncbi:uncharacterized protein LOC115424613 isoform X2 [Sphaeramia orbicularis]|uniref:uncharacterized protein LOC115424613 isoform X2 n=1 Tax=Sphaeramia orbicularis TaxID=375764 RepID=UPI00117C24DF|nr:uncharacterized protein LOC115424613 isoform X2 [Sphaeramia orbicularis]